MPKLIIHWTDCIETETGDLDREFSVVVEPVKVFFAFTDGGEVTLTLPLADYERIKRELEPLEDGVEFCKDSDPKAVHCCHDGRIVRFVPVGYFTVFARKPWFSIYNEDYFE